MTKNDCLGLCLKMTIIQNVGQLINSFWQFNKPFQNYLLSFKKEWSYLYVIYCLISNPKISKHSAFIYFLLLVSLLLSFLLYFTIWEYFQDQTIISWRTTRKTKKTILWQVEQSFSLRFCRINQQYVIIFSIRVSYLINRIEKSFIFW